MKPEVAGMQRVLALLALAMLARVAQAEGEVRVYGGSGGVVVTIVNETPDQALVAFGGVPGVMKDAVLLHSVASVDGSTELRTMLAGDDVVTLAEDGKGQATLHLPGEGDRRLKIDDARAKAIKAENVRAAFTEQSKSGRTVKLAAFDRAAAVARLEAAGWTPAVAQMQTKCGIKPKVTIDWSSVSDETVKHVSIVSYCRAVLTALSKACAWADGRRIVQAKVKAISCTHGPATTMALNASGVLVWTIQEQSAEIEDLARIKLETTL